MPRLNNKYSKWLLEIVIFLVVLFAIKSWMQRDVISGSIPDLEAKLLSGEMIRLTDKTRRPLLLHFWATWCPVCKLEEDNIESISHDYAVVTIAMKSGDNEEIKSYMQEAALTFNVINDQSGLWTQAFGIRGVPVSFVINNENKIVFTEVGYTTEWGLRLRLWWAGL